MRLSTPTRPETSCPQGGLQGIRSTDGTEGRLVSSVSPMTNELGEVAGALGFVRDVTER